MSILAVARPDQVEAVYRESHSLWGAGLSTEDYLGMWVDLQATTWGRRCFRFLVWIDPRDRILSAMKLYRPDMRVNGHVGRAWAIGAIFTPRAERGRGHAAAMLDRVVAESRAAGEGPAILFSDIGTRYYERRGFHPLPAEEALGVLGRSGGKAPAGWALRPMLSEDIDPVREAHEAWCAGRRIAFLRDRDHWQFLMERARSYFTRFDGSALDRRYRVATRDGRFAGYVVSVAGARDWDLREVGAIENDVESLTCILKLASGEARASGMRRVFGWIPRSIAALMPEWKLRYEPRLRAIPMLQPTHDAVDLAGLSTTDDAFIPYLDQF